MFGGKNSKKKSIFSFETVENPKPAELRKSPTYIF